MRMQCMMSWWNATNKNKTHGDNKVAGRLLERRSWGVTTLHHHKRISSRDLGWHRRETEGEEVKQIASLTNEWNHEPWEVNNLKKNTMEMNEIENTPLSKRNKEHCENLCRLKNMEQELNGSKGIWKHTGRKEKQGTPCEPWSLQSYEWREQWTRSTCKHSGWNEMYKEQ